MRPFANIGLHDYRCVATLFWTAIVISGGRMLYNLTHRGETRYDVSEYTTFIIMEEANQKRFPVICLN